jgi:hypothetical protein
MTRKTFFSFRYKKDNWRASIVRNSWVTKEKTVAVFFDSAEWEKVEKQNDSAIEKWINEQLDGTSVTVILIGGDTAGKKWINYEIKASHKKGNGLLGIYIHSIKDSNGYTSSKGRNPFDDWYITKNEQKIYFSSIYKTYDWVKDDGVSVKTPSSTAEG